MINLNVLFGSSFGGEWGLYGIQSLTFMYLLKFSVGKFCCVISKDHIYGLKAGLLWVSGRFIEKIL